MRSVLFILAVTLALQDLKGRRRATRNISNRPKAGTATPIPPWPRRRMGMRVSVTSTGPAQWTRRRGSMSSPSTTRVESGAFGILADALFTATQNDAQRSDVRPRTPGRVGHAPLSCATRRTAVRPATG